MDIINRFVTSVIVAARVAEEFGISGLSLNMISSHRDTLLKQSAVQYLNERTIKMARCGKARIVA
jgi:hypothetical protein